MTPLILANDQVRVTIAEQRSAATSQFDLATIELRTPAGWRTVATGQPGAEFSSSLGSASATSCEVTRQPNGDAVARLSIRTNDWEATEMLALAAGEPVLRRTSTYRFRVSGEGAVHPGLCLPQNDRIRYTYPLQLYEQPLHGLPALRCDSAWAVPVPFHIWHDEEWLAIYGIDRRQSGGTLDFSPPNLVRSYLPDHTAQTDTINFTAANRSPGTMPLVAGQEVRLEEVLVAKPLRAGDVPLLEATRWAAEILMPQPRPNSNWKRIADGFGDYYRHCDLWNPDALGKGRGWFGNMWVHTAAGTPAKTGECSGIHDFGWGEGFGVRAIAAIVRHWQRARQADLLPYVNEMTRSFDFYRRPGDPVEAAGYYDRFFPPGTPGLLGQDTKGLADFLGFKRMWSHCLGHVGHELLALSEETPDYPLPTVRATWRATAESIARFLAKRQRPDGDLQDGFDEQDGEVNLKPHRIPARAAVCGLWARLGKVTGDREWTDRASRLARPVAHDIEQFNFYNQMLDTHSPSGKDCEITDSENAIYALQGLVELYDQTHDAAVLRWLKQTAAYTFLWMYDYDLPTGYNGVTRGGTCCRMTDYPLIYLGAAAQAVQPLSRLSELTGDPFYRRMAGEMMDCIARYRWNAPGKAWDGALVHALDQTSGRHWGPNREGQVDSGMTSGTSLIALEYWLAHQQSKT